MLRHTNSTKIIKKKTKTEKHGAHGTNHADAKLTTVKLEAEPLQGSQNFQVIGIRYGLDW